MRKIYIAILVSLLAASCVSLERLSLPPGLRATFNEHWGRMGDFTHYNGDNGSTWTSEPAWEY